MVRALSLIEYEDLQVSVAAQDAPIEVLSSQEAVDPQGLLKPFTDWSKGALARQHADGRIEYATMFVKKETPLSSLAGLRTARSTSPRSRRWWRSGRP